MQNKGITMEEPKYDGGAVIIQNQLLSLAEDFEDIRKGAKGISEEVFAKTVKFCWLISEGKPKLEAYSLAYDVNPKAASTRPLAVALTARKYTGEILNRMLAGNHVLMADKHVQALNEMFDVGMDKSVGMMHRVNALSKFVEFTKKPEAIKIDYDVTIGIGQDMVAKIDHLTKSLAAKGSMLDSDGEIIETVVLD